MSKFTATVKIPIVGDETVEARPPVEEITESVLAAEAAINEVAGHLARAAARPTSSSRRRWR